MNHSAITGWLIAIFTAIGLLMSFITLKGPPIIT